MFNEIFSWIEISTLWIKISMMEYLKISLHIVISIQTFIMAFIRERNSLLMGKGTLTLNLPLLNCYLYPFKNKKKIPAFSLVDLHCRKMCIIISIVWAFIEGFCLLVHPLPSQFLDSHFVDVPSFDHS